MQPFVLHGVRSLLFKCTRLVLSTLNSMEEHKKECHVYVHFQVVFSVVMIFPGDQVPTVQYYPNQPDTPNC